MLQFQLTLGQSQIARGIECYLKALEIYREVKNHDKELELLVGIGLNYQKLGELNQTIEFFEHALKVSRYLENRKEEVRILVDLGDACYHLGNHEWHLNKSNTNMKQPTLTHHIF
ncbi:tetratricopeptide repeat protein [Patescibacteria group bacterium]|nr:tetratricopeptide repeat protein [Patescibacteria group bacterium]